MGSLGVGFALPSDWHEVLRALPAIHDRSCIHEHSTDPPPYGPVAWAVGGFELIFRFSEFQKKLACPNMTLRLRHAGLFGTRFYLLIGL